MPPEKRQDAAPDATATDIVVPKPIRRVRLRLTPYGKVAKYGPNVYKFSRGRSLRDILARRGWTLVRQTKDYAFLQTPAGGPAKPPFEIDIAIPTREQGVVLAQQCRAHGGHRPWALRVGEWVAFYFPEGLYTTQQVDPFTGARRPIEPGGRIPAHFDVGEFGIWSAWFRWDEAGPQYGENMEHVIDSPVRQQLAFEQPTGGSEPT